MKLVVKNGIAFINNEFKKTNMIIEDEKISAFSDVQAPADKVLDAGGMFILPGAVDAHAHLTYPEGEEDFHSGTRAAAAGGYTMVVDMNHESGCTTRKSYENKKRDCGRKAVVDYGLCSGIVVNDSDLDEIMELAELGSPYVKLFMPLNSDYDYIYKALNACRNAGITLGVHAEDMQLIEYFSQTVNWKDPDSFVKSRPPISEKMATVAILELALDSNSPVHFCHTSTAETANLVNMAREVRNIKASIEIQPHYLILDESDFNILGPYVKTTPPLRNSRTRDILWKELRKGSIDFISSDHFYCSRREKEMGKQDIRKAPGGIPGIEHSFSLMYHYGVNEGKISFTRLVELMAIEPAKFCGYYPRKGNLAPGSDADFILFDPHKKWTIKEHDMFSAAHYTPFAGRQIKGKVLKTFVRGREVFADNNIKMEKGFGKYIPANK